MTDSMLREAKKRIILLALWAVLAGCVVIGSPSPATSPVIEAIGRLHISDKVEHFGAYLGLSLLAMLGFRCRRQGILASLSMFLLGLLLEAGQHFSPGRAVDFNDVMDNAAGVSCGVLLGFPIYGAVIAHR